MNSRTLMKAARRTVDSGARVEQMLISILVDEEKAVSTHVGNPYGGGRLNGCRSHCDEDAALEDG